MQRGLDLCLLLNRVRYDIGIRHLMAVMGLGVGTHWISSELCRPLGDGHVCLGGGHFEYPTTLQ